MKIIIWQNIISIHQSAFIKALSNVCDVTLIVEKAISNSRKQNGWSQPNMGKAKILISPQLYEINRIITENKNEIHFISGINWVFRKEKLMKILIQHKCKIICYSEPYNWRGILGLFRYIKYLILIIKFRNSISGLLTTGEYGFKCFKLAGFPSSKIYNWGYFTEQNNIYNDCNFIKNKKARLLFVGSINENKNIILLSKVCKSISTNFESLFIIGNGPSEKKLLRIISGCNNISFLGALPNQEVLHFMRRSDILILPSKYDGWGAVVNEALQSGMRVVVSKNCGSSVLINNSMRGEILKSLNKKKLCNAILNQAKIGGQSPEDRLKIINWCKSSISGEKASEYFMSICDYILNKTSIKPNAPWI